MSFKSCLCGYFFCLYFHAAVASAASVAVPLDGEPFTAELVSVDASGRVTFRETPSASGVASPDARSPIERTTETGKLRTRRLNEFVRWGNPAELRPQTVVVLADGGRLITAAAWEGGAAVRLDDEAVIVLTNFFDEVRLPRALVRGVVFAQQSHPSQRERLEEQVREADGRIAHGDASDKVLLTNQDQIAGEVRELSGGSLELATADGLVKLPLSRVEAVLFGHDPRGDGASASPSRNERGALIAGLRDGSLLYVDRLLASEQKLSLLIHGGVAMSGGSADDLVFLQSLRSRITYLSDLEASAYRHVPYLSIEWPYQRDRNVLGEPLVVGGKRYVKGIGMHSAARLSYRLDGQYQRFQAAVAMDDSAGSKGSVTFAVYVLRDGAWTEAYSNGIVRGGEEPQPISVDVTDAEGLTLTVDYADRGDELDRANWLDARLVKDAQR
jgi:hypothetical protein